LTIVDKVVSSILTLFFIDFDDLEICRIRNESSEGVWERRIFPHQVQRCRWSSFAAQVASVDGGNLAPLH
jgi:hypothetical protein